MFDRINEPLLFFLATALFFIVIEIGFRLGRHHRNRVDDAAHKHYTSIQSALLGLLALLLGFNFAMASTRFETRKALVQDEVNAIGTAYLRAELLPPPHRDALLKLLDAYLDTRINVSRAGTDESLLQSADAQASLIDAKLWNYLRDNVPTFDTSSPFSAFSQSLNDMINLKWKRRGSYASHVPAPVTYLLFIVSFGALGFMAYGYGLIGPRRHISTAIYAILIASVMTVTLDIDRPRGGVIRVSEDGMLRLKSAFEHSPPPASPPPTNPSRN